MKTRSKQGNRCLWFFSDQSQPRPYKILHWSYYTVVSGHFINYIYLFSVMLTLWWVTYLGEFGCKWDSQIYLINQDYFYCCPQCFDSILICFVQGYVGSKSFLEEVLQVVHDLRQANPNLVFGMYLSCEFSSWGTVVCSNIQYWIGVGLIIKFWNYFFLLLKFVILSWAMQGNL